MLRLLGQLSRRTASGRSVAPVCRRPASGPLALTLLAVCLTAANPQPSVATTPTQRTTLKQPTTPASTPQSDAPAPGKLDERKVLEFVRQHQPKLLKLLRFLEDQQPTLYAQALKEMSRSQQRLETLATRDPELYSVELQLWQVRSELRLLAAELMVSAPGQNSTAKSPSQATDREAELVRLVEQEAAHELARVQLLHERTRKELSRLETQMEALSEDAEEQVARKVQLWKNRIHKGSRR